MNKYLLEISKFFGGKIEFEIEAEDKSDALSKGMEYIKTSYKFDNCKKDTLTVIKKLQSK